MSVTVAILISDTKCGIERNDFFIVLKAEVLCRELDSISGLVGVHIDLCEIVKAHCNTIVEKYIDLFYEFENKVKDLKIN